MKKIILVIILIFSIIDVAGATPQTRLQLRTNVRELLCETDEVNSNFTNTQINNALNFAINQLSDTLPDSYQYKSTVLAAGASALTISASSESVALPSNFKKMIAVSVFGDQAIPIKWEQWFSKKKYATTADPLYSLNVGALYVLPIDTSSHTCEILYIGVPDDLTSDSSTITLWGTEIEPIVCLAAASYLLKVDGQFKKAEGFDALVSQRISVLSSSYANTNTPEPNKAGAK